MKAALYLRTSTRDGRQHLDNQRAQLEQYAAQRGWSVEQVYVDQESGAAGPGERPGLAALFDGAARGRFSLALVWSLDRFHRGSIQETFAMLHRLRSAGVEFWSLTEEHFRTSGPAGDLLLAVAAWIADQERRRIGERVRAGLDRAVLQGKRLGRPRRASAADPAELRAQGKSLRQIAKISGLPRSTVVRRLHELKPASKPEENRAIR